MIATKPTKQEVKSDDDLIVRFKEIDWETPAPGVRQKTLRKKDQQVRLLEFSDELNEEDWCLKGHIVYVVEGELSIHFKNKKVVYSKGDGLWIMPGEKYAHKPIVEKGGKALLVLFEELSD